MTVATGNMILDAERGGSKTGLETFQVLQAKCERYYEVQPYGRPMGRRTGLAGHDQILLAAVIAAWDRSRRGAKGGR